MTPRSPLHTHRCDHSRIRPPSRRRLGLLARGVFCRLHYDPLASDGAGRQEAHARDLYPVQQAAGRGPRDFLGRPLRPDRARIMPYGGKYNPE